MDCRWLVIRIRTSKSVTEVIYQSFCPTRYFSQGCICGCVCYMSMAKCKTAVSPLLTHWRYCSLALAIGISDLFYLPNTFTSFRTMSSRSGSSDVLLTLTQSPKMVVGHVKVTKVDGSGSICLTHILLFSMCSPSSPTRISKLNP